MDKHEKNCADCQKPLQLQSVAESIGCALCQAITYIDPRHLFSSNSEENKSDPHHPPPPPPTGLPPSPHGRKKAVICGIVYRNTRRELKGCINDAKCMRDLLINKFNYPESSIVMLTEEETDPSRLPTRDNIKKALLWLVEDCQAGDSLLFHFSGHGSRQKDDNGDEIDGYDETLCPLDYQTQGMIVDDEINETIVRPLPHGVKLHAIIDACHSGTVLDLPYLCRMKGREKYEWEDHHAPSGVWKGTSGGEAFCFSSCDDDQTSADSSDPSKITPTGAMTFCFIQAIERGLGTTYGSILSSMQAAIRNPGNDLGGGALTQILSMLLPEGILNGGLNQEPLLSACEPFDLFTKPFSL